MIKVMITLSGAASAKGTLIRNAIKTAERITEVDYPTFDAYLAAIETRPTRSPSSKERRPMRNFVFGLKHCPFGPSIKNYTKVFEKLPDGFADFTAEFNKPSNITDQYRVGEGAGVQPLLLGASADAERHRRKDQDRRKKDQGLPARLQVRRRQKGFAEKWLPETGFPKRSWTRSWTTICAAIR